MIPINFIRVDSDIDTLDQIVFRMIQYWIKYLACMEKSYVHLHRSPNIIKYFLFLTHKCVLHVSDMLHLSWLWYWHSWSHCVRNDPVLDQIPGCIEKSYVQLHRSPNIIKNFWFASHNVCFTLFPYIISRLTLILTFLIQSFSEWYIIGSNTWMHGDIVCSAS